MGQTGSEVWYVQLKDKSSVGLWWPSMMYRPAPRHTDPLQERRLTWTSSGPVKTLYCLVCEFWDHVDSKITGSSWTPRQKLFSTTKLKTVGASGFSHLIICEDSLKLGLFLSTVWQDGTGVNETDTMVNRAWDFWLSSPQHQYLTKAFGSFHLEPSCPVGHG